MRVVYVVQSYIVRYKLTTGGGWFYSATCVPCQNSAFKYGVGHKVDCHTTIHGNSYSTNNSSSTSAYTHVKVGKAIHGFTKSKRCISVYIWHTLVKPDFCDKSIAHNDTQWMRAILVGKKGHQFAGLLFDASMWRPATHFECKYTSMHCQNGNGKHLIRSWWIFGD